MLWVRLCFRPCQQQTSNIPSNFFSGTYDQEELDISIYQKGKVWFLPVRTEIKKLPPSKRTKKTGSQLIYRFQLAAIIVITDTCPWHPLSTVNSLRSLQGDFRTPSIASKWWWGLWWWWCECCWWQEGECKIYLLFLRLFTLRTASSPSEAAVVVSTDGEAAHPSPTAGCLRLRRVACRCVADDCFFFWRWDVRKRLEKAHTKAGLFTKDLFPFVVALSARHVTCSCKYQRARPRRKCAELISRDKYV